MGDLGFCIKFKKVKGGGALSVSSAQSLQASAAETMLALLDYSKALKVLLPKEDD